jgi:hypothetical protein
MLEPCLIGKIGSQLVFLVPVGRFFTADPRSRSRDVSFAREHPPTYPLGHVHRRISEHIFGAAISPFTNLTLLFSRGKGTHDALSSDCNRTAPCLLSQLRQVGQITSGPFLQR